MRKTEAGVKMNQQSQTPVQQGQPAVSKGLLVTFIIVILIGAAFAAWYFLMGPGKAVKATTTTTTTTPVATTTTPSTTTKTTTTTTTSTADWKTFTGTTYGFSFKYPPTWTIKDHATAGNSSSVDIFSATDQIKDASGVQQPNIIVGYVKDLSAIPSGNTPSAADFQATTADSANSVTIANIKGYWKNVTDSATVFVKNGTSGYYFTLWGAKTYTATSQTVKDILSTFTFTK